MNRIQLSINSVIQEEHSELAAMVRQKLAGRVRQPKGRTIKRAAVKAPSKAPSKAQVKADNLSIALSMAGIDKAMEQAEQRRIDELASVERFYRADWNEAKEFEYLMEHFPSSTITSKHMS